MASKALFRTGRWVNFGPTSTSSVLWRSLQASNSRGHRRTGKSPQRVPSPSLKAVAFRVAQLCASHLPPPDVHQGPAACKPAPFPVLRAYMSHTGHPDAAHLRQLVSVTSWLGLDPFIQWWVYWLHSPWAALLAAAASAPCLLAGVISQAAQEKNQQPNRKPTTAFSSPNCTCSPFTQIKVSAETWSSRGFPSSFIALSL